MAGAAAPWFNLIGDVFPLEESRLE